MEKLRLPAPANALFRAVHGVLDELIRPVSPSGTLGRLGGGTTLAARWAHRASTDIDVTVPVGTGLGRFDPRRDGRLVERMAALGATHVDHRPRSFTFTFPTSKLDVVEMDPQLGVGHALAEVDGLPMEVYSNAQILCGRLEGRGNALPERDIFDIAVAAELDPVALAAAVNHLEEDYRREVVHCLHTQADRYRSLASAVLNPTDARWRPLLLEAPARAASAIETMAYASIEVAYGEPGIILRLDRVGQHPRTQFFGAGNEFVDAILKLGLAPCFLNVLGPLDAIARHVDEHCLLGDAAVKALPEQIRHIGLARRRREAQTASDSRANAPRRPSRCLAGRPSALSQTKHRVSACAGVRARGAVSKAYRAYSKRRQQSGRMPAHVPFGWQREAPQPCCARSKYAGYVFADAPCCGTSRCH